MRRHNWGDFFEKISHDDVELYTNVTRPSCSCLAFQIMPHLRWSSDQTASDRSSNTGDSFIFIICVSSKVQGQISSNSIFRGSPLRNKRNICNSECPLFNERHVFFSKKEFNLVFKECIYISWFSSFMTETNDGNNGNNQNYK